jgi:hypothetical protein
MTIAAQKLALLHEQLVSPQRPHGALLVIYPPEEELAFRTGYDEIIQELTARGTPNCALDFRTLAFEALQARHLLEKAFALDARGDRDARQNLAGLVQGEAAARVLAASKQDPEAVLLCQHTSALYPWISYAELLDHIEGQVYNTLVIPFPGTENGPMLHFLGLKQGYNYRAARV